MRIAILQGPFLPVPPLRGGAIEKAWFRLGKAFAKEGHEVVHVSRLCDDLPQEETIEGVALGSIIDRVHPQNVVICEPSQLKIKHAFKENTNK